MEAAPDAAEAPGQHGPQQQIAIEPLTEALEQQGSEQQTAAEGAQDAQAPERPRPEQQDGAALARRPAGGGQAQAAERLRPEQQDAAAADAGEQQGPGRPAAPAAEAEASAEQQRPEQHGAAATEGQAQEQQQQQQQHVHVISSWPECLAALNSYVRLLEIVRQGRGELLPGGAEGVLQQVHASIVDYLSMNNRVAEVLEILLIQASVGPRDLSSQTTRSGSVSNSSSSGRDSGRGDQTSESGPAGSSGSNGVSSSTVAHASGTVNSYDTTRSSFETHRNNGSGSSSSSEHSSTISGQAELTDLPPSAFWANHRCTVTTLMVYHVPTCFTQQDLIEIWQLEGSFNFLYRRNSPARRGRLRIVIIDFVTCQQAIDFKQRWQGYIFEQSRSKKPLAIVASSVQGRDLNLMLVLDKAPVPPAVSHGGQRLSDARVREMVTFAKHGLFFSVV